MKVRFLKSSRVAAKRQDVFAFHERPDALATLAGNQPIKVVQLPAGLAPGTVVVLKTRVFPGVWTKWVAKHTACQPGYYFCDTQVRGPFRSWNHVHRFISTGPRETLMVDEIEYELPFGRVGQWLLGPWIARKLQAAFDARHRVLAEEFGVPYRGKTLRAVEYRRPQIVSHDQPARPQLTFSAQERVA